MKRVILIGEAAPLLAAAFDGIAQVSFAADLDEAVMRALSLAGAGDAVLLAPRMLELRHVRGLQGTGRDLHQGGQEGAPWLKRRRCSVTTI